MADRHALKLKARKRAAREARLAAQQPAPAVVEETVELEEVMVEEPAVEEVVEEVEAPKKKKKLFG